MNTTRPEFGNPAHIRDYVIDPDRVYEFYELVERPNCPDDLRDAYYTTASDIDMIEDRSDPRLPDLWKAVAKAEKALRAWAKGAGYRVTPYAMREEFD